MRDGSSRLLRVRELAVAAMAEAQEVGWVIAAGAAWPFVIDVVHVSGRLTASTERVCSQVADARALPTVVVAAPCAVRSRVRRALALAVNRARSELGAARDTAHALLAAHVLPKIAAMTDQRGFMRSGVRAGGMGCVGLLTFIVALFVIVFLVMTLLALFGG